MTPDQIDSILIGVTSFTIAGLSFIYASKAQRATKDAEKARQKGQELAVDATAYRRAAELYESGIQALQTQNHTLQNEITDLRDANTKLTTQLRRLENRTALLERCITENGLKLPRRRR